MTTPRLRMGRVGWRRPEKEVPESSENRFISLDCDPPTQPSLASPRRADHLVHLWSPTLHRMSCTLFVGVGVRSNLSIFGYSTVPSPGRTREGGRFPLLL